MGYKSIEDIITNIIENNEKEKFLEKLADPKYAKSQERIRYRGYSLSKKMGLFSLSSSLFKEVKKHFFNASLNELYRCNYYGNKMIMCLGVGIVPLTFSLVSDNELLIQKIAHAGKELNIPKRNKGSINLMLQCAMRDDVEGLKNAISAYEKYAIKKRWHELQLEFYKAFIAKNETKIKKVLTELETSKLKKQDIFYGEFIDDYLSVLTTAYLKLCWRKGLEIYIESDTVPMEMMPIEPLFRYELEYPYLEGWETDSYKEVKLESNTKTYEAVGPYPEKNPSLRNQFVSENTVSKTVEHFCTKHKREEKDQLISFIWDAYTDPRQFDFKYKEYVQENACFPVVNNHGDQVLEARPFWSELTENEDEDFFRFCNHFIIMNEMSISNEKVEEYLELIKSNLNKGGFFKRLFG